MKISTSADIELERSGIATDGSFTIEFNAKMAKILSDGLYSDKIQSIIRELSCNAVDSHVESGQPDRPIEVHLPTVFEPWFYVKDFGVGLDHSQILNHFTRYGASTKTNSNDYIGQLGLGCKSPFSYVDAFDVTSVKAGVSRQYSMYKDEQGMPSVALLGETATSEPNGVTVKMPVKREDIHQFSTKAVHVFMWFRIKPNITGKNSLEYPSLETEISGNGWSLRKNQNYDSFTPYGPIALMGRVAYPLDKNAITDIDTLAGLFQLPLIIEFAIGDLEVSASRESIGYDKRTQANIRSKLENVAVELRKIISDKFSSATNEYEARKTYYEIFKNTHWSNSIERLFPQGIYWNKIQISSPIMSMHVDKLAVYSSLSRHYRISLNRNNYNNEKVNFDCSGRTVYFVDDLTRGGIERTRYYIKTNGIDNACLIVLPDELTFTDLQTKCQGFPFKLTSSLPQKPKIKSAGQKISTFVFNDTRYVNSPYWESADIQLDDGGVYVNLIHKTNKIETDKNHTLEMSHLQRMIKVAKDLNLITADQKIYGIKREARKSVQEHDDWDNLFELVTKYLQSTVTSEFKQKLANSKAFTQYSSMLRQMAYTTYMPKNPASPLAEFSLKVKHLKSISSLSMTEKNIEILSGLCQFAKDLPAPEVDLVSIINKILSTYPLLEYVLNHHSFSWKSHGKMIIDYVDDIDTAQETKAAKAAAELISA